MPRRCALGAECFTEGEAGCLVLPGTGAGRAGLPGPGAAVPDRVDPDPVVQDPVVDSAPRPCRRQLET